MLHKADGTEVWPRISTKSPYLSLAGVIESSEDDTAIRQGCVGPMNGFPGIASDDAVLALRIADGSGLVFCARPGKNRALLLPEN
ncbi:hypothetical protein DC522_29240 [Microvirga sp. KLBC 81]|uniref:hypothetical protein n=1 Tax=Microvirga TaxID=186650 RepID=UPI00069B3DC2|nr:MULTISPECIES: hypothetical protein [Microvirga]PVE20975.1 hypothetical protein DC522_29240 [Microvirga sp. KLBC 81]